MPFPLIAAALLYLFAGQAAAQPLPADWRLERVVMVERHGVRSPTKPPEALSPYASEPWPAWPVEPGMLTSHGRQGVVEMGRYFRALYAKDGLWPAGGCPATPAAYVWADGQDQRTRESGQALLDGLFPGCRLTDGHGPAGEPDAIFDAASSGLCKVDMEAARRAILARIPDGDLDHPGPGYEAAIHTLSEILAPHGGPRGLPPGPNRFAAKGEVKIDGPLGIGATMAENLYLEYAEGFPLKDVGWGRIRDEAAVAAFMPVHNIDSDLTRGTAEAAAPRAALLLRTVLDALEGATSPAFPGEPVAPASARFVAIAGHDTNIANLAGLLGLNWTLPDQPDATPPGGALVFEVWRDEAGERWVSARFISQTLDQLRRLTPLDAAHPPGTVVKLSLPSDQIEAPYAKLQTLLERLRREPAPGCKMGVDR